MKTNPSIFKAYDIRGKYPREINEEAVAEITKALARYFQTSRTSNIKHRAPNIKHQIIVVGRDARLSSLSLYKAVLEGIMNKELRIKNFENPFVIRNSYFIIHAVGMVTTPMLYFLVNRLKAVGGIMITASHNPKEYNGLKVVGPKAEMISGKEIYELYKTLR